MQKIVVYAKDSGLKHERGQFDQFDIGDFKVDPTNLWFEQLGAQFKQLVIIGQFWNL